MIRSNTFSRPFMIVGARGPRLRENPRRLWIAAALIALLPLSACDDESDDSTGPGTPTETTPEQADVEPKVEPKPISALFNQPQPALVGPFASLSFDMTTTQARQTAPELFEQSWGHVDEEYPDATFMVQLDEGLDRIELLWVKLPQAEAEKVLREAWGAPEMGDSPYWVNPKAHLHAQLVDGPVEGQGVLELSPYTPINVLLELVDQHDKPFPIETILADLKAHFGPRVQMTLVKGEVENTFEIAKFEPPSFGDLKSGEAKIAVALPTTVYGNEETLLYLTLLEGQVTSVLFAVPFDYPAAKDLFATQLTTRYGEPKPAEDQWGNQVSSFKDTPRITARQDEVGSTWFVQLDF